MYNIDVDGDVNWVTFPTKWKVFTAKAECPECGEEKMVQPMPGYVTSCTKCNEVLVVFPLPILLGEDGGNCCTLKLCMRDGRSSFLHTPGFFEFGEWVL